MADYIALQYFVFLQKDLATFTTNEGWSNLGPRVFSDKAADEDPGKIHFIAPKFWGKKRMRNEAQRMLLIKNNVGAYYF